MGIVATLFNDSEPFEQFIICHMVKTGQAVLEEKIFKDYEIL